MQLRELQASIRAGIMGAPGSAAAVAAIARDRLAPEQRLQIHRNNFHILLTDALAATFPVVRRLTGERFFHFAARRFIAGFPPRGPCLFEYGGDLPAFLARLPALDAHPYMADVARFEWAINEAYHAADAPALDVNALRRVPERRYPELVFRLHPSVRLLLSPYPIVRIWRANQPEADDRSAVDLAAGGVQLLIFRNGLDVLWRGLSQAEFAFVYALRAGSTVRQAHESALAEGFGPADLAATLAGLVQAGLVSEFILPSDGR